MGSTVQHPRCGKTWTGLRREHCPSCCETFSGTRAGDRHRKGPHTDRRCAPPQEVGLVQDPGNGVWSLPPSEDAPWS